MTSAADRLAFLQAQSYIDTAPQGLPGPPLLLLHGFCESHDLWQGILPALAAHHRVIAPTLAGHGGRPWDSHWRSLDDAAYWLRDLLDALGVTRCVLVGHSLGGYIAAAFADLLPDRLAGLCFLHSTSLADAPERQPMRDKAIAFVQAHGKEPFLQAFVRGLFHDPQPQWLAEMDALVAHTDQEAILALTRIMRDRPDRSKAVKQLGLPVMYIVGGHDGLVSPERSAQELQDLPIALMHRIAEASHMGMYEAPGRVVDAILSLMEVAQ